MSTWWHSNNTSAISRPAQAKQTISRRRRSKSLFNLNVPSLDQAFWWEQRSGLPECFQTFNIHFTTTETSQHRALNWQTPVLPNQHPTQNQDTNNGLTAFAQNLLDLPKAANVLGSRSKNGDGGSGNEPKPSPKPQPQPIDTGYGGRKEW